MASWPPAWCRRSTRVLEEMAWKYFHLKPLFLTPGTRTGMAIHYDNPQEVGADRIADSVAAFEKYGGPCIVVDFGTAITFDVVSEKGEYLGGAIAPGLGISAEALFEHAAKLPRVEIREPQRVIGSNTVASMQSGLFYGAVGLVDGILDRLCQVLGKNTKVSPPADRRRWWPAPQNISPPSSRRSRSKACGSSTNGIERSSQ